MNRRLRARHRTTFAALAVALPVGFALALAAREDAPPSVTRPRFADATAQPFLPRASSFLLWTMPVDMGDDLDAEVGFDGERVVLLLVPRAPLRAPDVLVYWQRDATGAEPVLLGALDGTRSVQLDLPAEAWNREPPEPVGGIGWITLYSLAHAETIASAAIVPYPMQRVPRED